MKILSWNVNGLRSVYKKGFLGWLRDSQADIVCLQETKAQEEQLPFDLTKLTNYHAYFSSAARKGYSGVAVYSKEVPSQVVRLLGAPRFASEGRALLLEYPEFILLNLYMPHGGRQKENLGYKLAAYDFFLEYLDQLGGKGVILAGDFNIAHREIDLARPNENRDNTMFTPEERQRIDRLLETGFTDSFRKFNQGGGNYTWWPYYADARKRNLGWRIDYVLVSRELVPKLKDAFILRDVAGSDHCPVGIEI